VTIANSCDHATHLVSIPDLKSAVRDPAAWTSITLVGDDRPTGLHSFRSVNAMPDQESTTGHGLGTRCQSEENSMIQATFCQLKRHTADRYAVGGQFLTQTGAELTANYGEPAEGVVS
jgi:hypothetical protein